MGFSSPLLYPNNKRPFSFLGLFDNEKRGSGWEEGTVAGHHSLLPSTPPFLIILSLLLLPSFLFPIIFSLWLVAPFPGGVGMMLIGRFGVKSEGVFALRR